MKDIIARIDRYNKQIIMDRVNHDKMFLLEQILDYPNYVELILIVDFC
jgi:hypothetical protein